MKDSETRLMMEGSASFTGVYPYLRVCVMCWLIVVVWFVFEGLVVSFVSSVVFGFGYNSGA